MLLAQLVLQLAYVGDPQPVEPVPRRGLGWTLVHVLAEELTHQRYRISAPTVGRLLKNRASVSRPAPTFVAEFKDRFGGVEPICRTLTEHSCKIAPPRITRRRSARPQPRPGESATPSSGPEIVVLPSTGAPATVPADSGYTGG